MWLSCVHTGVNNFSKVLRTCCHTEFCAHRCDWAVSTQVWITSVRCYTRVWLSCVHTSGNNFSKVLHTCCHTEFCAHGCDWAVSTQVWITSVRCYTRVWLSCVHTSGNNFSKVLHTCRYSEFCAHRCDWAVSTQVWITSVRCYTRVWLSCVHTGVNNFSKVLHTCRYSEFCAHRCEWGAAAAGAHYSGGAGQGRGCGEESGRCAGAEDAAGWCFVLDVILRWCLVVVVVVFLEEDGAAVGVCVQWGCTVCVYSVGEEGAAQGLRTQRVWWGWAGACCLCVFLGGGWGGGGRVWVLYRSWGPHRCILVGDWGRGRGGGQQTTCTFVLKWGMSCFCWSGQPLWCFCSVRLQPDKDSMRWFRSNPGYDVTFTLVNPQPDVVDVQWDIQAGVQGRRPHSYTWMRLHCSLSCIGMCVCVWVSVCAIVSIVQLHHLLPRDHFGWGHVTINDCIIQSDSAVHHAVMGMGGVW